MKKSVLIGVALALVAAVPYGCSRQYAAGYPGPTARMVPHARGGGPPSGVIANGTGTERPNPQYFTRTGENPDTAQRYPMLSQQQPPAGIGAWALGTLPPSDEEAPPDDAQNR